MNYLVACKMSEREEKKRLYAGDEAAAANKKQKEVCTFNAAHIHSVCTDDEDNFNDFSGGMEFVGRGGFAGALAAGIKSVVEEINMNTSGRLHLHRGTAFVYSTVPGAGKTRSMLEIPNTVSDALEASYETASSGSSLSMLDGVRFGYTGFNSNLHLTDHELSFITDVITAKQVLLRRVVGSVLLQPQRSTMLPRYDILYEGFDFPSSKSLTEMLVENLNPPARESKKLRLVIVGVDEVQLLNKTKQIDGDGLGRLFLRFLRQTQVELIQSNVLLVPVGTGVLLDFSTDGSSGDNKPLNGHTDAVLIKKDDFRTLAERKYNAHEAEFNTRYGDGAKETILDKVAVVWWPRVRLIEKWKPRNYTKTVVESDSNSDSWPVWLERWMRRVPLHTSDKKYMPGNASTVRESRIGAVFELDDIEHFEVIPDVANIEGMVTALMAGETDVSVKSFYEYLIRMATLDPSNLVFDHTSFEKYGFHVIGSSLYFGTKVLSLQGDVSAFNSPLHTKRLGLAYWVHDKLPGFKPTSACILGANTARKSAFYPYTNNLQTELLSDVKDALDSEAKNYNVVFIHTGQNAKCDYLYLFRLQFGGKWIALVADGKHTDASSATLSGIDQIELIEAAISLKNALGEQLSEHRTLFFTNRDKQTDSETPDYKRAVARYSRTFDDGSGRSVNLETLGERTFQFSPFSDILFMRRNKA